MSSRGRALGVDGERPASERYQVLGRIASGGMAEIYLARLASGDGPREVALKRLRPELQANRELVEMFFDEARIAAQLQHPNIAEIYELGELEGSLFLAMELVRGVNLKAVYQRASALERGLPLTLVSRIALGALAALEHAHGAVGDDGAPLCIVHRDVSPQNILVGFGGEVKLVDFGVARAEGRIHATRQGVVKGKLAYMAPEQIAGEPVDGRADLFALAEVIYLLALRRHPFYADTDAGVLQAVLECRPPSPTALEPRFPAGLAQILSRAMQRRPDDRWPDARAMREALEAFLGAHLRAASTDGLTRWMGEAFAERLELEAAARRAGDDDLLVEALRGRAQPAAAVARPGAAGARSRGQPRTRLFPDPAASAALEGGEEPGAGPPHTVAASAPVDPAEWAEGGATADLSTTLSSPLEVPGPLVTAAAAEHAYTVPEAAPEEQPTVDRGLRGPPVPHRVEDDPEALTLRGDGTLSPVVGALQPRILVPPTAPRAAPEAPRAEEGVGRRFGRYMVKKRLGGGSLGDVYRAAAVDGLEKGVALRRFHPRLVADHAQAAALASAVQRASRLAHPNIVAVWDLGFEGEELYAVVELVHGWDLASILARCRARGVALPVPIAGRLLAGVLAALDAAHTLDAVAPGAGPLLHGDLSPGEVLVSSQGGVKLTDFGLATAGASPEVSAEPPRGHLRYAAPERISRQAGVVDPRSDLYSAGAVLYEALTLRPMFERPTVFETMMAIEREPVPRLLALRPDAPASFERLVEQAVARAKAERWPSARAFLLELERALARCAEPVTPPALGAWLLALFGAGEAEASELGTDAALVAGDFVEAEPTRAAPAPPARGGLGGPRIAPEPR